MKAMQASRWVLVLCTLLLVFSAGLAQAEESAEAAQTVVTEEGTETTTTAPQQTPTANDGTTDTWVEWNHQTAASRWLADEKKPSEEDLGCERCKTLCGQTGGVCVGYPSWCWCW